jgi:hypothetical protein
MVVQAPTAELDRQRVVEYMTTGGQSVPAAGASR